MKKNYFCCCLIILNIVSGFSFLYVYKQNLKLKQTIDEMGQQFNVLIIWEVCRILYSSGFKLTQVSRNLIEAKHALRYGLMATDIEVEERKP